MKIVIAPDSFKESMTAKQVAHGIRKGFLEHFPQAEYVLVPMSDGGEGLIDALQETSTSREMCLDVTGPLGEPVAARYCIVDNATAVIETAEAAGIHLVDPPQRNPLASTSYGVGELLLDAFAHNVEHILLGVGGSATNDGGAGMLQALGFRLLDANNIELAFGGAALANLQRIESAGAKATFNNCSITVICDVTNPLLGELGASAVYGPQKGADQAAVNQLDAALSQFSVVVAAHGFDDHRHTPGAGAAGGLGYALCTFLQADMRSGVAQVIAATQLEQAIQTADLVITGEGRMDLQTCNGKVPWGVLQCAQQYNVPVIGVTGSIGAGGDVLTDPSQHSYFAKIYQITPSGQPLATALKQGPENLYCTATYIAANWKQSLL